MNYQSLLFLSLLLITGSCSLESQPKAKLSAENANSEWFIAPGKSFGKITRENGSMEAVKALYGEDVREDSIYVAQGFYLPGLVVFPGQKNEFQIAYEPEQGDLPTFFRVEQKGTDWKTIGGVTVGSTLEDVENANGTGLSFKGFGNDYGGVVTEWYGGKLEGLSMTLAPAVEEFNQRFFRNNIEFGTVNLDVSKKDIIVVSIGTRFLSGY